MNEINKTNSNDRTKFWLNEISKIEHYFNHKINQRKTCSKKLRKSVAAFDYIDKVLNVLSARSGGVCITTSVSSGVCITTSVSVVGAPIRITGVSFTLIFSLTTGIIKNLLRNKKKKDDKILMLAKNKLNSIESLVSQPPIDVEISHEEIIKILKEKDKYEKMKENVRSVNEKLDEKNESMRLNSVDSRT